MRTKTRIIRIRLIAWLSSLACVAAVLAIGGAASATGTQAGPDASVKPAATTPSCQVAYSVTNDWGTGFGISITITNNGPALTSWTLGYSYAGSQTLQQGWSGTWSQTGTKVSVVNASWNGSLATGANTQIGANFNNSGSTNTAPTVFTLNGTTCNGTGSPTQPAPTVSLTSPTAGAPAPPPTP